MIEKLLEYQQVDEQLRAIEQELSSSEDRKKGISAKKFLDTVNDSLAELNDKAIEFDNAYTRYTGVFNRLLEVQREFEGASEYTSEDEIKFVKKKAQELSEELKELEKQIVRLQSEIISLTEQYNTLKKKTAAAQKQFKESGQRYTELKASKADAQNEIKTRLAKIEKDIEPEAMELYKKKRADKIYPILFEYKGTGFCPNCRTEISKLAESKIGNGVVPCDNCGRLLYKK